jgi:protoporphyrinogen/coproporphyrinogen III oxidase
MTLQLDGPATRSGQAVDIAVVGGGIAGLAAAYELRKQNLRFVVLERAGRVGGVILSERVDGFTIDAGPDALLTQKRDAIALCEELGISGRLTPTQPPRLAYIQRAGRLHALPAGSVLGIPTEIAPFVRTRLFSWPGKIRMAAEPFVPRRDDGADESIAGFIGRRFGAEAVTYLAEPLLAGIHAGDVNRLSMPALFPRLVEAEREHGSLIRAFRRSRFRDPRPVARPFPASARTHAERAPAWHAEAPEERWRQGGDRSPFVSLPGGLSELVNAVAAALPADAFRVGTAVQCVSPSTSGQRHAIRTATGSIEAGALILATPAYVTSDLVRNFDVELARLCIDIPYASAATVAMAFDRDAIADPLHGSGFVVPRVEQSGILASSWLSSKWPHRAPDGRVLLRTFVGGARDPRALDDDDEWLVERSLKALTPIIGIRKRPIMTRVYRFPRANAQHEVGHLARVAEIERALANHPGLFVTGSGFRGTGIPDCIADGRRTARAAADFVRSSC